MTLDAKQRLAFALFLANYILKVIFFIVTQNNYVKLETHYIYGAIYAMHGKAFYIRALEVGQSTGGKPSHFWCSNQ